MKGVAQRQPAAWVPAPSQEPDVTGWTPLQAALPRTSRAAGAAAVAIGVVVLLGWALDIPVMRSTFPGAVEMKVNTAIAFVLAGAALLLRGRAPAPQRAASGCASGVAVIGVLTLIEFTLGWDLKIDQALFTEPATAIGTSQPGRMAPTSAVCFVLLGLALRAVDSRQERVRQGAELLVLPVALNSLLVAGGYLYGVGQLVGIAPNMAMAVPAALAFAILSAGVLLARSDGAFARLMTSDTAGGATARRFLPVALVPIPISLLGLAGQRAGLYGDDLRGSLVAVANVATLSSLVWIHARALHGLDLARSEAKRALQKTNEELEARIAERTSELGQANADLLREHAALRASETALRDREESLATTLNSIGDGVIATDAENRIVRMNPVAERLTGWTLAEAQSRAIADVLRLVDDETGSPLPNPVPLALCGGVAVAPARHAAIAARDGARRPVTDLAAPIRDGSGRIRGVVLALRDVSEERQTRQALSTARTQLEFSARMASVGTLAAGVGHEINNPLSFVTANLAFLAKELTEVSGELRPGRLRELEGMLNDARDGAERIRRIVRDLRTFASANDDRRGPVDLKRVVEWSTTMVWNEIRHRARLVKDLGDAPAAHGNESRLGQVLVNLLINAAQAIPEGNVEQNEIRVTTRADERGWSVLEVRDTGGGIAPGIRQRIFDPFFTTKDVGAGTGLGLTICHNIVTDLGGEISVESEVGKGACFRVALAPARLDASDGAPPPAAVEGRATEDRRGRVLIVDDEPMVSKALRRTLATEHDVVVSASGAEALERLGRGERFDVILCDLMMPEMTGMELHAKLSERSPPDADRVVFLTGGAFTPQAREFLDRVPNQRMEKPFDPQALRVLVRDRLAARTRT